MKHRVSRVNAGQTGKGETERDEDGQGTSSPVSQSEYEMRVEIE